MKATAWECPCGTDPPKRGREGAPVRTLVSLMEPMCPFCGRKYLDDYRVNAADTAAGRSAT